MGNGEYKQKNFHWSLEEEALYKQLETKGWGLIRIVRLGLLTAHDIEKNKEGQNERTN